MEQFRGWLMGSNLDKFFEDFVEGLWIQLLKEDKEANTQQIPTDSCDSFGSLISIDLLSSQMFPTHKDNS
jgi:hypothetical protein